MTWLLTEQSISLQTSAVVNMALLLVGACVGYMLSAARRRKGIWSSAFQLTGFFCACDLSFVGLDFCVCALPACSFQE